MTTPGWYGEPGNTGIERYWDGAQWTPSTRPSPAPGAPPPTRRPPGSGVGIPGLIVVLVAVVAVVIALVAAAWFKLDLSDLGGPTRSFNLSDLRSDPSVDGLAGAYISWLAWVLLVGAAAVAVVACLPTPQRGAFRVTGILVAVLGAGLTIGALFNFASIADTSFSDLLHSFSAGPYLATFGFLVIAVGAALGDLATTR